MGAMAAGIETSTGLVGSSARHPGSGLRIEFLHLVVVEWKASVILGSLPFELAAFFMDVTDDQRTLRAVRFIRHVDRNSDAVLARTVGGRDGVLAAVAALHVTNHQFAVVVTAVDLDRFRCPVSHTIRIKYQTFIQQNKLGRRGRGDKVVTWQF